MFQQCKEAFPGLPVDVSGNLRQADLHPGGSWRSGPPTQWILGGPTLSAKRPDSTNGDHPPHGPTCCRLALQLQLQNAVRSVVDDVPSGCAPSRFPLASHPHLGVCLTLRSLCHRHHLPFICLRQPCIPNYLVLLYLLSHA